METKERMATVLAEDVEIIGSVKCANGIRIDGRLEGDLQCGATATLGASAALKGNLQVESVSVMGQVNGNIEARDRIELKSTARMHGDIKSKRLTVEDGVTFVGKVDVNPSGGVAPAPRVPTAEKAEDSIEERKGGSLFGKR